MKNVYIPCYLTMMWFEKIRKGSMCLNYPELVHNQLAAPCIPCFPSKDVFIKGSVQLNHPELI